MVKLTRRRFLKLSAGAFAGGAGALSYAYWIEPHWVEYVERDLPIRHLPDELVGKRLIQISDLHIGQIVDDAFMANALQKISALDSDVLVITGDFMSCYGREQIDHVMHQLQHLKHARLATIAVLGNHDYGVHWQQTSVADELSDRLIDYGVAVLRNEVVNVRGLHIGGVEDFASPRFDPAPVMKELRDDRATLMLCHNPDAVDQPAWHDYRGWTLSGHTHGGQCRLPLIGAPIVPIRNACYTRGKITLANGGRLYVNRGLGYLKRVRFMVRPEVTVFRLCAASWTGEKSSVVSAGMMQ